MKNERILRQLKGIASQSPKFPARTAQGSRAAKNQMDMTNDSLDQLDHTLTGTADWQNMVVKGKDISMQPPGQGPSPTYFSSNRTDHTAKPKEILVNTAAEAQIQKLKLARSGHKPLVTYGRDEEGTITANSPITPAADGGKMKIPSLKLPANDHVISFTTPEDHR